MHLGLGEVLAKGHVGQLRLLLLNFEKTSFDGVFDDELDGGNGAFLAETMLEGGDHEDKCVRNARLKKKITYDTIYGLVFNGRVPKNEESRKRGDIRVIDGVRTYQ